MDTETYALTLPNAVVKAAFGAVLPAACKDTTRPNLCAVHLDVDGDTTHLVTTNGHQLYVYGVPTKDAWREGAKPKQGIQLSVDCTKAIIAGARKDKRGGTTLELVLGDKPMVTIVRGDTQQTFPLHDHDFPPWRKVVPDFNGKQPMEHPVAIDFKYLAMVAAAFKAADPEETAVTIHCSSDHRGPVLFRNPDVPLRCVVMQRRLDN
jgi:DNA polymerase III sliding clamp (beta) subunit (PCNA family)